MPTTTTRPKAATNGTSAARLTEIAWAAGFFDGEGCITYIPGTRSRRLRVEVKQASTEGCPDVLRRFLAAVEAGRLGGPYVDSIERRGFSPRRRPVYYWWAWTDQAIVTLRLLLPHLTGVKRDQAIAAIEVAA